MTTAASFHIGYTQYLGPDGVPVQSLPAFARDPGALIPLYCAMVLTRAFDTKAVALQRTGKLGTFASSVGQEAIGVGVASAMRADDVLFPSYRDHAAQLLRGVTMTESLLYWGGDERGSDFAVPRHDFPNCVPIGTQVCHAAGAAYAFRLRGEPRVAVAIFGDGSTSKGDFYEAMNMAGIWQAPLVLVINNNQWAISVPRSTQSAAQTLAQKAIAAGIDGLQVDGNDVIAVHQVMHAALAKARRGDGPTLVEALSYRLGDHTTADDATRYRDSELIRKQWDHEPRVAVAIFGDGATSKGDFYEAMNMAGVWRAPLVLVINDNQWAISVPRSQQTAAQTLAQKAIAAGIDGLQVDGNDVIAVREVAGAALARARRGDGPTLIEALSYRLGDHTTADDATRYRDAETVSQRWEAEPLRRLRLYLMKMKRWDKEQEDALGKSCHAEVERAVEAYLATPAPGASAMFDHLYAVLPEAMKEQLAAARRFAPAGDHDG